MGERGPWPPSHRKPRVGTGPGRAAGAVALRRSAACGGAAARSGSWQRSRGCYKTMSENKHQRCDGKEREGRGRQEAISLKGGWRGSGAFFFSCPQQPPSSPRHQAEPRIAWLGMEPEGRR